MTTVSGTCPRCRAQVLTGVTMRPGFEVTLDPRPLDPPGELDAIADGRRTCTLHTAADQLAMRGWQAITHRPASTRCRELVLAEHRCEKVRA